MEKQRIAIYCAAQMYPQWEKAFAAYSIVHADPAQPLTELLLKAAKSGVSLFAILDGAQKSDANTGNAHCFYGGSPSRNSFLFIPRVG